MAKKILFIHYRIKERDGVSLEIEKRANIFEKLNHKIYYLTGYSGVKSANIFILPEADLKTTFNRFFLDDVFYKKFCKQDLSIALYYQQEARIYHKLKKIFAAIQPDLIFIHNVFSHCYNLPFTTALLKFLDNQEIRTVAVHHDFWYERAQFQKPKQEYVKELLIGLPPKRHYILWHEVINSLAAKELLTRRKLQAKITGDYFDFTAKPIGYDNFNTDFLTTFAIEPNDVILLHATRITPRKAIENAFYFAHELERTLRLKAPLKIKNKVFQRHNRVVIFLPNFIEVDSLDYFRRLKLLAESLNLKVVFAADKFAMIRQRINNLKRYSLWDSYVYADLITYTSVQEGFGNQFLEAVYFRKLPIIYEYPVFKADIAKEGYRYVSLGDYITRRNGLYRLPLSQIKLAVEQTLNYLTSPASLSSLTEHNFQLGMEHHDRNQLNQYLISILKQL